MNKKSFVVFSPMPINKVTPRCFNTLFKMLKIVEKRYAIKVIAKNKKQLNFFKQNLTDLKDIQYVLFDGLTYYRNGKTDFYYDCKALMSQVEQKLDSCDVFYMFSSIGMIPLKFVTKTYEQLENQPNIKVTFHSNVGYIYAIDLARTIQKTFKPRMYVQINDYNEPNLDKLFDGYPVTMLGFYDEADSGGYKHSYNVEYDKFTQLPEKLEKTLDFTFGYLMMVNSRKYLSDFVQTRIVETDKVKIHAQDKFWKGGKRDDLIPVEDYYHEPQLAKYTLAPPATVLTEVSTERIYDALVRDCLPIFMKCTNYKKVFKKDFCDFIGKNLVFDDAKYNTINEFIDALDYNKLIDEMKSIKSIQELYSISADKVLNTFE